jgi:hypothetical protein
LKQELQNVLTTTLKWWSTKLMMGLKAMMAKGKVFKTGRRRVDGLRQ